MPQNVLSPVCWTLFSPVSSLPAVIAQLGERKTEDLKVSGSIPDCGTFFLPGISSPEKLRFGHLMLIEATFLADNDIMSTTLKPDIKFDKTMLKIK